jgi:hypothetical protein
MSTEQRNAANEKNTAQPHMNRLFEKLLKAKDDHEIIVALPLYGPIDFSPLKASGQVTRIVFKERGGITELTGLPSSVVSLECENQLLHTFPNLPANIETVRLGKNIIPDIRLSPGLERLKTLSLPNCQIKTISGLPKNLEELYIPDNQVRHLHLGNNPRLRVLHIQRNRTLRVENVPASIVDLQVEEGNPLVELEYDYMPSVSNEDAQKNTPEYMESLDEYFRLKGKYETEAREMREREREKGEKRNWGKKELKKRLHALHPKCVNCHRPVGTVFKRTEGRYLAYCGDRNAPCALKMELFRGDFLNTESLLYHLRDSVYELKEDIIQKKMDVLFGYMDEAASREAFQQDIEHYHLDSAAYKDHLETWNGIFYDEHRKELIRGKRETIHELKGAMNTSLLEYEKTGNRDLLHTIAEVYTKEYLPEIHNLRRLNYEIMEMEPDYSNPDSMERTLVQNVASAQKREMSTKEVPRVIQFIKGLEPSTH